MINKIDYTQIDPLCIPMIKYFNSIGLVTKFSCEGHDNLFYNKFQIIFDNCVTDKQIQDFIMRYSNDYDHSPFLGQFYKWGRKIGEQYVESWIYEVSYGDYTMNQKFAKMDYKTMIQNVDMEEKQNGI